MKTQAFLLHALSPLHAGTGQAVDVIDLPIARMTATGMPYVPGSSIKGVLRDALRNAEWKRGDASGAQAPPDTQDPQAEINSIGRRKDPELVMAIFGPEAADGASEHAGALMAGDARLLALPVRSYFGTFAWVTSPLLLALAQRDFQEGNVPNVPTAIPNLKKFEAAPTDSDAAVVKDSKVLLVDLDIAVNKSEIDKAKAWGEFFAELLYPSDKKMVTKRFLVVDDETMTFLWETATQVETRIRLDPFTRTVAEGALWIEESLPPESLLVGLLVSERIRRPGKHHGGQPWPSPEGVLEAVVSAAQPAVQFGGKATIGRGRCRFVKV